MQAAYKRFTMTIASDESFASLLRRTEIDMTRTGMQIHIARSGMQIHMTRTGMQTHMTSTGMQIHTTRTGMQIHMTRTGMQIRCKLAAARLALASFDHWQGGTRVVGGEVVPPEILWLECKSIGKIAKSGNFLHSDQC